MGVWFREKAGWRDDWPEARVWQVKLGFCCLRRPFTAPLKGASGQQCILWRDQLPFGLHPQLLFAKIHAIAAP
ncbi:hypothetical protein ACC848_39775, partial [Rhizobium johnstonii]